MFEFKIVKLADFVYQIRDPQGVCISIIKGSKLSLVIDTGYGIGPIREFVEQYIETPYKVICTHGHMDHTSGAFQFDEVYIPENDMELYYKHMKTRRQGNLETAKKLGLIDDSFNWDAYINATPKKVTSFKVGDTFDLGNHKVEIIDMAGHTQGSIGLYLKNDRLLFTGDAAIHNIWLFLKESTDRATYIESLERVLKLDFDKFITGHLMEAFDKKLINYYLKVAKYATASNSTPHEFAGFELPNTYQYSETIDGYNIGICFQEPKEN